MGFEEFLIELLIHRKIENDLISINIAYNTYNSLKETYVNITIKNNNFAKYINFNIEVNLSNEKSFILSNKLLTPELCKTLYNIYIQSLEYKVEEVNFFRKEFLYNLDLQYYNKIIKAYRKFIFSKYQSSEFAYEESNDVIINFMEENENKMALDIYTLVINKNK